MKTGKTAIVTGASQGIGACLVKTFLERGYQSISKNLAMEYAKGGIRLNTVAPGVVDTPLHKDDPKEFLRTLSPMGSIADTQEIVDAVVFLAEAPHITGEVLHVDGGEHLGKW